MPWRRHGHGVGMIALALTRIPEAAREHLRPNFSIMKLSTPGALKIHYGPVVVVAYSIEDSKLICHNMQMRDYRWFIDFYQFGRFNTCVPNSDQYPLSTYNVRLFQAVKYNSDFDARRLNYFARKEGKEMLPGTELV